MVAAGGAVLAIWWFSHTRGGVNDLVSRLADIEEWQDTPVAPPGYLGTEACAPCHAKRVAEFKATRHFQACRVPRPGEMPVGFQAGHGTYRAREPALQFEMVQVGDRFFQTSVQGRPTAEKRTSAPIALIYGGGGVLDEVYFTWHDTRLYELPVTWLHPQHRWAIASENLRGEGDFGRDTTPRCLECHNTWFEHVPGTRNQYNRDNFILGLTCEKCHGSGRDHIAWHQANPKADTGHAIVHPGHLTRERLTEVCTQCHSNAIHPRTRSFQYRPGEALDDYYKTIVTRYPEEDHVANQAQYMRQSKCFQKSDDLTCVTCHNPHRSGEAARGTPERSCLKCHKSADCGEQPRLPAGVRSNCVGCHMPARVWMNVHFHTEDDQYVPPIRRSQHQIAVDPIARQEVLLAWYRGQHDEASQKEAARLTARLVEHWLAEGERRQSEHRLLAAIGAYREALRLEPSTAIRDKLQQVVARVAKVDAEMATAQQEIDQRRFGKAIDALNHVLALNPNLASAHGKLGTAYAAFGQTDLGVKHLQAVARYDANDPYGYMMLGWLAYLRGDADDAVAAYCTADEIEPFNSKTHYHWGLALAKQGKLPEAVSHFHEVLKIDPDHAGACQALGDTLRRQGKATEAVSFAKRAARLTNQRNADVLLTLAEAYADAGRYADAVGVAGMAVDAAKTTNPELAGRIRWRLEQLRSLEKSKAGK
jgi:tetratricopeptide (TPR) repeat protein